MLVLQMLESLIDPFKTGFMEINGQGLKMPKSRIRNKKKKSKSINTKKKNIKLTSSSQTLIILRSIIKTMTLNSKFKAFF